MSVQTEIAYFRRREAQSCELGHASSDNAVKIIHFKLAEEYAARIVELERKNPGS